VGQTAARGEHLKNLLEKTGQTMHVKGASAVLDEYHTNKSNKGTGANIPKIQRYRCKHSENT
jgi:hypothetical protein